MAGQRRIRAAFVAMLALAAAAPRLLAADGVMSWLYMGTGDFDTSVGLSSSKTYVSAANVGGSAVTINGVSFATANTANPSGTGFTTSGLPNALFSDQSAVTGQLGTLLDSFDYGGATETLTLNNLSAGQTYTLTFYNRQWDSTGLPARGQTATATSGASLFFYESPTGGAANSLNLLRYTFTATGTAETISFAQQTPTYTFHMSGFSTEQVFNNAWVSGTNWTTAAWSVGAPNAVGANADFGAQASPTTMSLDAGQTVGNVRFSGTNAWTLAGSSTLTLAADVGAYAVLSSSNGVHEIAAPTAWSSNVFKTGSGTLVLSGSATSNGKSLLVGAGDLRIGSGGTTGSIGDTTPVEVSSGATLTFNRSNNLTYGGAVSGAGTVVQQGTGNLALAGANTHSGGTRVAASSGTLSINNVSALGTGRLTVDGGTLDTGGVAMSYGTVSLVNAAATPQTWNANVTYAGTTLPANLGSGTVTLTGNRTVTVPKNTFAVGGFTGGFTIEKAGTGTLVLQGAGSQAGTTVSAGTLQAQAAGAFGTGAVTVASGATLSLGSLNQSAGGLSGAGSIVGWTPGVSTPQDGASLINASKTYVQKLDFGNGTAATVNGVAFTTAGTSGTGFTLTGATTGYNESGSPTGYAQLMSDFYYNGNPGTLTFTGLTAGTAYEAVLYTQVGAWPNRVMNATFTNGASVQTVNGLDEGAVGAVVYGFVASGTSASIQMAPTVPGTTFHWFGASLEQVGSQTLTVGDSGSYNFSGNISGSRTALAKIGSGTQALSGANTYAGTTTVSAGVLQIGNGGTTGSISDTSPVSVASGATLAFNRSNTLTYGGTVSGAGGLAKLGAGTLAISGSQAYNGPTTISDGVLQIAISGTGSSLTIPNYSFETPTVASPGYIYNPTGASWTFAGQSGMAYGTFFSTAPPAGTQAGFVQGTGSFSQSVTTGTAGFYQITFQAQGRGSVFGPNGVIVQVDGATAGTWAATDVSQSQWLTYSSTTVYLTAGSHTLAFLGNNTAGGDKSTSIDNVWAVQPTSQGSLPSATAVTLGASGATLDLNGTRQTVASLSGVAGSSVRLGYLTAGGDGTSTTFAGSLSTVNLTKVGAGTLTLTGSNAFLPDQAVALNAGVLALGSAGALGPSGTVSFGGGTLQFSASNTTDYSSRFSTGANQAYSLDTNGQTVTLASALASAGGSLTKVGGGTLTLSAANTYTGPTTVSAGVLQIGSGGATGSLADASPVAVAGGATLAFNRSDSLTYGGTVSGDGGLVKLGGGVLTLSAASTYTGTTNVNAGTLAVTAASLASPTVNVAGGAALSGTAAVNAVTVANSGILTPGVGGVGTLTLSSLGFSGSATVNVGVQNFTTTSLLQVNGEVTTAGGANAVTFAFGSGLASLNTGTYTLLSYTGSQFADTSAFAVSGAAGARQAVSLANGTQAVNLVVGNAFPIWSGTAGSGWSTTDNWVLNTDGAPTSFLASDATVFDDSAATGSVTLSQSVAPASTTFSGTTLAYTLSSSGGFGITAGTLVKNGPSTLTISTSNSYAGGTTLSAGTLRIGNNAALGTGVVTVTGGTITSDGATARTLANAFALGGNVTLGGAADTGALTLSGTIDLGASTQTLTNPSAVTLSGAVVNGGLAKSGSGTLTLSGSNTYSGGTQLNGGMLALGSAAALGSSGAISFGGGTLQFSAANTTDYSSRFGTAAGQAYRLDTNGQNVTLASALTSVGGSLVKLGSGTLTLAAANTFSGTTTVSAGVLQIGAGGASGSLASAETNVASGVTLVFNRTGSVAYSGVVSGSGSLTNAAAGTLALSGASTYTGVTAFAAGVVEVSALTNYGVAGPLGGRTSGQDVSENIGLLFRGGTLRYGGTTAQSTNRAIRISTTGGATIDASGSVPEATMSFTATSSPDFFENPGNRTLTLTGSNTGANTFAMQIAEAGGATSLVKSGGGRWVLMGANTYTGATTISGGTLQIGAGGTSGSISASTAITDNGTLVFNRSDAVTVANTISGSGAFVHQGAGTLVLTGPNTYTGATTVSSGTLQVGSGGTSGSISSSSTITNNGTIVFNRSDAVTVAGAIAGSGVVVQQGSGNFTLTGANTHSGGTRIAASSGTFTINNASALGTGRLTLDSGAIDTAGVTAVWGGSVPFTVSLVNSAANPQTWNTNVTYAGATLPANLGSGTVTLTGNRTVAVPASTFAVGGFTGGFAIEKTGTGTLVLQGAGSQAGTTVSAGTLQAQAAGAFGTGAVNVATGATLALGSLSQSAGGLSGAGSIVGWTPGVSTPQDGASLINASKNYVQKLDFGNGAGATVNGVAFNTAANSGPGFTLSGATSLYGESGSPTGYAQLMNDFYYNGNPGTLTFTGLTAGTAYEAVLYTQVGAWNDNRVMNATFTNGSSVQTVNGLNEGAVGAVVYGFVASGTSASIQMAPTGAATFHWFGASLEQVASQILTLGDSGNYDFSGSISGIRTALAKIGSGTQTLSGSNSFSGGTTLSAGTLVAGNQFAFGTGGISIAAGSTLDLANLAIGNTITNNGGTILNASGYSGSQTASGDTTYVGTTAGTVSVAGGTSAFSGPVTGTINVASGAAATFAGGLSGSLNLDGGSATVTSSVGSGANLAVGNGSTLVFGPGATVATTAILTGAGTIEKTGTSILGITGSNPDFTGSFAVSAGGLTVNGLLGSSVSVAQGAVLGGSGTITGAVSVLGTLSPGNSPGLLTVGSLVLGGTSTTNIEITGLTRGVDYDAITVTDSSGLTYGGSLLFAFGAATQLADNSVLDVFAFAGDAAGAFSSVTSTGYYAGTWTSLGGGIFQLQKDSQTLTFSQSSGDIIVVPEPTTLALVGLGGLLAAVVIRRRA